MNSYSLHPIIFVPGNSQQITHPNCTGFLFVFAVIEIAGYTAISITAKTDKRQVRGCVICCELPYASTTAAHIIFALTANSFSTSVRHSNDQILRLFLVNTASSIN